MRGPLSLSHTRYGQDFSISPLRILCCLSFAGVCGFYPLSSAFQAKALSYVSIFLVLNVPGPKPPCWPHTHFSPHLCSFSAKCVQTNPPSPRAFSLHFFFKYKSPSNIHPGPTNCAPSCVPITISITKKAKGMTPALKKFILF